MGTKIVDLRRVVGSGSGGGGFSSPDCIMEWTIAAGGDAAARTITLFGHTGTTLNNYDVDWGDGTAIETGITTVDKTHEYPSDASIQIYTVTITDQFGGLRMQRSPQANRDKLTKFANWGTSQVNGWYGMFYECGNMLYEATDAPDNTNLISQYATRFEYVFFNCESITALDLSGWENVSNFTTGYEPFKGLDNCTSFNLSGWDLSNSTSFFRAFHYLGLNVGCDVNLSNVNLSNATTGQMFGYVNFSVAPNFTNLDLSGLTLMNSFFYATDGAVAIDLTDINFTNAITDWSFFAYTSEATSFTFGSGSDFSGMDRMDYAFGVCPNLTSVTFPSNADFSNVTRVDRIFNASSNLATVDLGTIQDFGAVTNWSYSFTNLGSCSVNFLTTTNIQSTTALSNFLLNTTLIPTEYDNLLVALSTANAGVPHIGGSLGTNSCNFTLGSAGETARTLLLSAPYSWTITDAGGV